MEEYGKRIHEAMQEEDYSRAIRLMEEQQNILRIALQRKVLKTIHTNPSTERKEISTYSYCFITVNPQPLITLKDFQKNIDKMLQKKWLTQYVYVLEQRGTCEEELGKGFHLHMIIMKPEGKSQAHCIREIASTFKKQCDTSNYHCYNTKWINEEEYKRKLEYILGTKESTEENNKQLKQEYDKIWREKCQIQPFYFLNIDIGQYAP